MNSSSASALESGFELFGGSDLDIFIDFFGCSVVCHDNPLCINFLILNRVCGSRCINIHCVLPTYFYHCDAQNHGFSSSRLCLWQDITFLKRMRVQNITIELLYLESGSMDFDLALRHPLGLAKYAPTMRATTGLVNISSRGCVFPVELCLVD